MKSSDIETGVAHIIIEIIEYVPNSVVTRTILNKTTGNVTVMSVEPVNVYSKKFHRSIHLCK